MAKEKFPLYVSSEGTLAIERASFTTRDGPVFELLKKNLLGGSLSPGTHGSGPLSYTGFKNKSGTLFCGENKSDNFKKLVVFEKRGTAQLESLINAEDDKQLLPKCTCTKVVCQGYFQIPDQAFNNIAPEKENCEFILQNFSHDISNLSGKNIPKASFSDKQKIVTVKFSSNNVLYLGTRFLNNIPVIFFELRLLDSQATNVAEAAYLSPNKSLLDGVATILGKNVQKLPTSFITKGILDIVNSYDVDNTLISKQERKTLKQNSKVSYTKSALNSSLRNLELLEAPIAVQYVPVFKEFFENLQQLSTKNKVALQILQSFPPQGQAILPPAYTVSKESEVASSAPAVTESNSESTTAGRRSRTP